jgi:diacylglycerol kinase (ATP)
MLLPPYCVTLKMEGWRGQRRLVVDSLSDPNIPNWSPLLVLANPSSGEKVGDHLLSAFRNLLNPAQVISVIVVVACCE